MKSKIFIGVIIIVGIYVVGRILVFNQLRKVIYKEITALKAQGIEIEMAQLQVGPWKNRVQLDSVRIRFVEGKGTDTRIRAEAGTITLRGIALYRAVMRRELWVHSVQLSSPFIQTAHRRGESPSTDQSPKSPALKRFFFKRVHIEQGRWRLNDGSNTPIRITTLDRVNLRDFSVLNPGKGKLHWKVGKTDVSAVKIDFPKNYYNLFIKAVFYNANRKKLTLDSIKLTPYYNKAEFAQKNGKQTGRLDALIPYLHAVGCQLESAPVFKLHADKINLKFRLESYVDKRYPFENEADRVLPVEFLQDLPIDLQIDTLRVEDSYAEHEERPEEGDATGKVTFHKINATLANLSNNKASGQRLIPPALSVTALFMGIGDLRLEGGFPHHAKENYYLSGVMYHFPFTKLNNVIEPLAKARIESGYLNWIKFNFKYNNDRSDGEVEMNYKDLKVTTFKKDNPEKKAKFKNFILNNFILKEDINEGMKEDKRTGTIQFYRDRRRSLLHYWWKSVFSGALSVYNIDKMPAPKAAADSK
ncbi:MAG: hypothetical protein ACK4TA_03350 [Saprospiraceae bacterium]